MTRQKRGLRMLRLEQLEVRYLLAVAVDHHAPLLVDESSFATDRVLLRLHEHQICAATCSSDQVLSSLGDHASGARRLTDTLWEVTLPPDVHLTTSVATLAELPGVAYAEPDFAVRLSVLPNDPRFAELWGLDNSGQTGGTADADIDMPEAWAQSVGSGSTVVAVIDTGVDYTHPDLAANMWVNTLELQGLNGIDDDGNGFVDDLHGYDFANNDPDPMDDQDHGTHVAGTIGAVGNNGVGLVGVNWNVQIMAVKFLDSRGQGQISDAIQGINYAVANGARISNNSWGFNGGFSQALYDSIAAARDADHVFVAAAGNGNFFGIPQNNDTNPFYPASFDLDNIIAVAATDHHDQLASFSNYGATSVDLAAPGVSILSTTPNNGYSTFSGTSMASPHVSGVVALLRDQQPALTFDAVVDRIRTGVDPIPALEGRMVTGGRLNAANAVVPDELGPQVVTSNPSGSIHGTLSVIRVAFNEGIDASSFDLDDVHSLTGPGGAVTVHAVQSVAGSGNRRFDVQFASQSQVGTYSLTIGPDILDLSGNAMDQNQNQVNGEDPLDQFVATVDLVSAVGGPTDYVALWQLDEQSGSTAADSSGNQRHGTLHGGAESNGWSSDAPPTGFPNAGSLQLDGTNDYVSLPPGGSLNITTNAVTLSAWVKLDRLPNEITGNFAGIFDSEQDAYILYLDRQNNELRFKVTDRGGVAERPGIAASQLDTTQWHLITGVYDGSSGTASIYLDGAVQDQHQNPALLAAVRSGQVAAIGRNGAGDRYYFDGGVDDVRVYDRALAQDEIQAIAQRRPRIRIDADDGLETSEAGRSDSFSIVLESRPQAEVTIPVASLDTTEATVTPASVTFTDANWQLPQTVTLQGMDDAIEDGHRDYTIAIGPAVSADAGYDQLDPDDLAAVNRDNEGLGGPADFLAYWKLDEGSGAAAADAGSGGLDGSLQAGTAWTTATAPTSFGNAAALRFDGVDDHVGLPAFDVATNAVTLSAWVKLDELPNALSGGSYAGIFDSGQDSFVLYEDDNNDELRFKVTDADGTAERPGIAASQLSVDTWHHLAGVYDGSLGKAVIYLDGQIQDSHTNSQLTAVVKPGQTAAIGRDGTNARFFYSGGIDDVRVYDRALTESEITALATRRAGITVSRTSGLLTTERGASDTFTVVLDAQPTTDVSIEVVSGDPTEAAVAPSSLLFDNVNWHVPQIVTVTGVDDSEVDQAVDYTVQTLPAVSADPNYHDLDGADVAGVNMDDDGPGGPHDYVAYWQLDEGSGAVATDISGGGSHGTLGGGLDTTGWIIDVAPTEFANNYALDFDGVNDFVALPAGGSLDIAGSAVTVALWVKLDELPGAISGETYAGIFDSEQDAYIIYEDGNNDELRFKVTDADGTAERPGIASADLDTARWHHIVGVYDGGLAEARIYLDGALKDTHHNPALTGIVKPGQVAALGRNGAGNKYFYNGQIDDVRVYDRVLTPDEISLLSGHVAQVSLLGFPDPPAVRAVDPPPFAWATYPAPEQPAAVVSDEIAVRRVDVEPRWMQFVGTAGPSHTDVDRLREVLGESRLRDLEKWLTEFAAPVAASFQDAENAT